MKEMEITLMDLFERLTDNEKRAMANYINDNTEGGLCADLVDIMAPWNHAKQFLYQVLGNELRIEKEVEYMRPRGELENSIDHLLNLWDSPYKKFRNKFCEKLKMAIDKSNNWDEVQTKYIFVPRYSYYNLADSLFGVDSLAENKYHISWVFSNENIRRIDLKISADKKISFEEGMRPVRVIGKIVKEIAPELQDEYESFRIAVSQITNQRCLKGYLGLSIHPLDYMTMSDNESGWSSCMSWRENGCYRAGTVEMMNSPLVVIGYLRGDKDMELRCDKTTIDWTNKKWRQLFIVDEHILTSVKGYPYYNESLEFACLDWLRDLAITNGAMTFSDIRHTFSGCFNDCIHFETNTMYNDFGTVDSHCYLADEAYASKDSDMNRKIYINYSGVRECMSCGNTDGYFDGDEPEGVLSCDNCWEGDADHYYCACCDTRLYDGDVLWINDECYCENCANKYFVYDENNGEWIDKIDAIAISIPRYKRIYWTWDFNNSAEYQNCINAIGHIDNSAYILEYDDDNNITIMDKYLAVYNKDKDVYEVQLDIDEYMPWEDFDKIFRYYNSACEYEVSATKTCGSSSLPF